MAVTTTSRGLGDSIAKWTTLLGIQPCGGCERRREWLNRWVPYRDATPLVSGATPSLALAAAAPAPASPRIEVVRKPILMSSNDGGWRAPGRAPGPLDWEGQRRSASGGSAKPAPGVPSDTPWSFACGIDVTESTKSAIRTTKSEFFRWSTDQRHQACSALSSLTAGDIAWDILDLHAQVTSDLLNKPFRPQCATSGATPACGSSVTIDGGCHFAGSANYVIFGIMCRLCFDHYNTMLGSSSWYEVIDKHAYRQGSYQFSLTGMLALVDLYKKYVPLLSGDSPAGNLEAAKRWSIAGFNGWPYRAPAPAPDRANCTLTCPIKATQPFSISWYPFVNPYARRRGIR